MKAAGIGGIAGAVALTVLHETLRRVEPDAPRMDLLGMQALSKTLKKADVKVPPKKTLFGWTMIGDLISNAIYYSAAGVGDQKGTWIRGALLGLGAGIGAVTLPKSLHLNEAPSNRTTTTKLLTVGLYLVGGLVASATIKWLGDREE